MDINHLSLNGNCCSEATFSPGPTLIAKTKSIFRDRNTVILFWNDSAIPKLSDVPKSIILIDGHIKIQSPVKLQGYRTFGDNWDTLQHEFCHIWNLLRAAVD